MKQFLTNIANLFKVKTVVTLVVIVVFAVLALKGAISPDNVMIIISMVVSFYFGTQHEKVAPATAATPQPPAETIPAESSAHTYGATSPVDTATYNQVLPDTVA